MHAPKGLRVMLGALLLITSLWIHQQWKAAPRAELLQQLGNIKVGEPAPDFEARDLAGNEVLLSSFKGHKVVLLDFWASWCGPCRMAMPELQELHDKLKDRGLQILSVNQRESSGQVKYFVNNGNYTFRAVPDEAGAIGEKYSVSAIPTMVVVDKRGLVQWIRVGFDGQS